MKPELIRIEDKLFELYRRVNKERIKTQDDVNFLKEAWKCDEVLEQDGYLYFVIEVKEVKLIN